MASRIVLANEPPFSIGALEVRPATRTVARDRAETVIEPRVMQVLVALARADGSVVSRDELIERCWEGRIVGDDAINRVLSRLRALAHDAADTFRIETITRVGYRLTLAEAAPTTADAAPPRRLAARPIDRPSRRALFAGGVAAMVVAAGGGALWLGRRASSDGRRASIAVMPFTNLSGDPAQAYFADGLAEELRSVLGRLPALSVIARTSSEKLRDDDAVDASRRLGVGHILTGSVRRSPSMIRVSAALIDGASGVQVWAQSYDRPPGDALTIESGIAREVARSLSVTLGLRESAAMAAGGTADTGAHDLYLKGNDAFGGGASEADAARALALADAALALDPRYALADVLRARALALLGGAFATSAAESRHHYGEAERAARRAIALAPNLGAGYWQLAAILADQLRVREALAQYQRARALGEDAAFLLSYGLFLARVGRGGEAVAAAERGAALDPLNVASISRRAWILLLARRYAEAISVARQGLAIAPTAHNARHTVANALIWLGRPREALAECAKLPLDIYRFTTEAIATARLGDRTAADRALALVERTSGDADTFQLAEIHAQRGERDQAVAALGRALAVRDPGLLVLPTTPALDPLRGDPRFKRIEATIDFP